jgi:hypothetical protein
MINAPNKKLNNLERRGARSSNESVWCVLHASQEKSYLVLE